MTLRICVADRPCIPERSVDLPKGQLAARLRVIPETLSCMFAKLSREGLIEIEGSNCQAARSQPFNQLAVGKSSSN